MNRIPMDGTADAGGRPGRASRGVQSVDVAARVLQALAQARRPLGPGDLATLAGLPPAQAHPYLVSLTRLGLLKRDPMSGDYTPGPMTLRLALLHLENDPAYRAAVPRVTALARETGLCVAISTHAPQGPLVVHFERAAFPLHVNLHVGSVMSLTTTSTGRTFCAFTPPAQWPQAWHEQMPAVRAERERFEALLDETRTHGMSRSVNTPSPSVSSLCAPVFDAGARLRLALTAIGPTAALDVSWDGAVATALRAAASAIASQVDAERDTGEVNA
ncbi:IclR family transcriptional regulator [Pandoraea apista]|uniref:IclR family transcriptional regulator n=1 Tax=Pandoraea apista TaxID=93218 RepID=UPI0005A6E8F5|nr:IclR family transcriptional regulator [Pandoraea apista]AJE98785.2 IclR family transcriptional regulator [Pandoraea apista]AKH72860.1 IclR family transcriptional regulator [Pandoraea apista]AKI61246.1 IclR family transcriptional regulator [Pandoraea apista]